jgi:hypothetical protein
MCSYSLDPITLTSQNETLTDSFETTSLFSRNVYQVFHLTRYAVNDATFYLRKKLVQFTFEFQTKFDIHFDAIKNCC